MASYNSLCKRYGAAIAARDNGWMCMYCYRSLDPEHAGMYMSVRYTIAGKPYLWGAFHEDGPCVDHIVPVSRGGPEHIDNYVLSCRACNSRKGRRLPGEYKL